MSKSTKEVTDLSPKNSEYANKIAAARNVSHPVGGAPMPKMPNFADAQTQDRHAGVQNHRSQGMAAILTPEQKAELEKQNRFIPGVGSNFAANQPRVNMPQTPQTYQNPPRPEGAGISEQTAEQLRAVAEANAPQAEASPTADKLKEEIDEVDDEIELDEFGNRIRNLLSNKERRLAIEGRCEPMDLGDLLVNKEVRQIVPIAPRKYEPEFRSTAGDEDLYVKRRIGRETSVSTQYVLSKMTLMNLTCGLFAINGKPLPSHMKGEEVDDAMFDVKYHSIIKYPMALLADLAVNYSWFDNRVRKLLVVDVIKDF